MSYPRSNKSNKSNAPCYGCKDRWIDGTTSCHSSCEKYIAFREEQINKNYLKAIHLNPPGCSYFKLRTSGIAPKSKARYR